MSILVIDVGTSSVRAVVVRPDGSIAVEHRCATLPDSPMAGLVEFDATVLATTDHGERFVSAVARGRLRGVEFHPERWGRGGRRLLANEEALAEIAARYKRVAGFAPAAPR